MPQFPEHCCGPAFVDRKAYCPGSRAKPAVIIGTDFSLWIGNEGDEELCLQASELAGFNLGQYEEKVVAGPLVDILLGMVWFYWIEDPYIHLFELGLLDLATH